MSSSFTPTIRQIKDITAFTNDVSVVLGGRANIAHSADVLNSFLIPQVMESNLTKVVQDKSPSILQRRHILSFAQDGIAILSPFFYGFVDDHIGGSSLEIRGVYGYAPSLSGETHEVWVYSAEATRGDGYASLISVVALSVFIGNFMKFSNGDVVARSQLQREYAKWSLN